MNTAIERTLPANAIQHQSDQAPTAVDRLANQAATDEDPNAPARGTLEHLAALERSAAELGGASLTLQAMQATTKAAREALKSKLKQREARLAELEMTKDLIVKQADLELDAAVLTFAKDMADGIGDLSSGLACAKKNKAQGKINEARGDLAAACFGLMSASVSSEARKMEADKQGSQLRSDLFKETQDADAAAFEQARDLVKQMLDQHSRTMAGLSHS